MILSAAERARRSTHLRQQRAEDHRFAGEARERATQALRRDDVRAAIAASMTRVWADPAARAARVAGIRAGLARCARPAGRRRPTPPSWLPEDWRAEYRDQARLYGSEKAAAIIRAMMADAAR